MSHTEGRIEDIKKALKEGYIAMSESNLEEAELSTVSDNEALRSCEEKLTECE